MHPLQFERAFFCCRTSQIGSYRYSFCNIGQAMLITPSRCCCVMCFRDFFGRGMLLVKKQSGFGCHLPKSHKQKGNVDSRLINPSYKRGCSKSDNSLLIDGLIIRNSHSWDPRIEQKVNVDREVSPLRFRPPPPNP